MKRLSEGERLLECLVCPMYEQCEKEQWEERENEDGGCKYFADAGCKIAFDESCSFGIKKKN